MSLHFYQATRRHQKTAVFNVTSARSKICHFVLKEDISMAEAIRSVQLNWDMIMTEELVAFCEADASGMFE
jgi:hypothetical protein